MSSKTIEFLNKSLKEYPSFYLGIVCFVPIIVRVVSGGGLHYFDYFILIIFTVECVTLLFVSEEKLANWKKRFEGVLFLTYLGSGVVFYFLNDKANKNPFLVVIPILAIILLIYKSESKKTEIKKE